MLRVVLPNDDSAELYDKKSDERAKVEARENFSMHYKNMAFIVFIYPKLLNKKMRYNIFS
jgi:hypothetical protein